MSWRDDDKHVQVYKSQLAAALEQAKHLAAEIEAIRDQTQRIVGEADKYSPRREVFDDICRKADNAMKHIGYFKHLKTA